LTTDIDKEKITHPFREAAEAISALDISEHRTNQKNGYSRIELTCPEIGLRKRV
jgi:hypothetical protein